EPQEQRTVSAYGELLPENCRTESARGLARNKRGRHPARARDPPVPARRAWRFRTPGGDLGLPEASGLICAQARQADRAQAGSGLNGAPTAERWALGGC